MTTTARIYEGRWKCPISWSVRHRLIQFTNKTKRNTNSVMVTSSPRGNRRERPPCLLVPYLIQFTEVSKCRIAPVERKASSVGWKHAKRLLQMDSEFSIWQRWSWQHFTLSRPWLPSSDGTRSRYLRRCWQRARLQCLGPHILRWCQCLRRC